MAFYGSGLPFLYGSGTKYVGATASPAQGIPVDLRFYRTSQDGIYTFWFGFDPAFITPALFSAGFDLQLDTDSSFTSPNLVTWTQLTAITYQNGNVRKGLTVPVAARIDNVIQTWYAQVRTHTPSFVSAWSVPLTWIIPQKMEQYYAESLMESLPDAHVYGKGDLLKPVNQRNTNLYVVEDMYGNQFDAAWYANYLTQTDNYVDMCIDENLEQNFGVLFNFTKPTTLQFVDYRWILMNLFMASLVGSTNEAIILTVQSFTGVPPQIINIRDEEDFFLNTIQDPPAVATISVPVDTSYPYIESTFVLNDNTTGLHVPSSSYAKDGIQGTWTLTDASLTGHTFQWMFDIGDSNDPFPVVFDALDGATLLTGNVTFTNGSTSITGSGTLFTSELVLNQQITDPNGIYLGTVEMVNSDTSVTLFDSWAGPTEVNIAYRLLYSDLQLPPPILWDMSTLKAGVLVTIFNPGQFVLV